MTAKSGASNLIATSVTSYLDIVFDLSKTKSGLMCYRGQADASWDIRPSVMRHLRANAESKMFSELVLEAPTEFAAENLMFNKLVKAQHYGLPTRLLDVSMNPLVGLYFACNEGASDGHDGIVHVFEFRDSRIKFADSDTVSLICNLVCLSDEEKRVIIEGFKVTETWGDDEKKSFRKISAMLRLTQFVRVEKPYFLDAAEPRDLFKYFFVYPSKNNRRLIAQSGAFIAAGLLGYKAPSKSDGFKIKKIIIPAKCKNRIIDELDAVNINSRAMFPEIDFASKYIKSKWLTSIL